jgi:hypothetical protein
MAIENASELRTGNRASTTFETSTLCDDQFIPAWCSLATHVRVFSAGNTTISRQLSVVEVVTVVDQSESHKPDAQHA